MADSWWSFNHKFGAVPGLEVVMMKHPGLARNSKASRQADDELREAKRKNCFLFQQKIGVKQK